ncbi:hypothetical protein [Flavobacterium sp. FlaQc-30]|uniref:hypothetical protein n=1 Tax=Flavobacterium sp. FlaQc-30 TaxID=3374179 RepID=UPI0037567589
MLKIIIFLYHSNHSIGWVGIIVSLFIALILRGIAKDEENKLINEGEEARTRLRKIGKRIHVSYNELEIKTNCWVEEVEVGNGRNSHNEYVDVNLNVLTLTKVFDNVHFREEYRIDMEPEILRMKLAIQKELSFYYDPNNVKDNFLDFEFLFDN